MLTSIRYMCTLPARCAQHTQTVSTTQLSVHPQNGIHDDRTQENNQSNPTTDVGHQFPRELLGRWCRVWEALCSRTPFFQLEHGRPFIVGIVRDAILFQDDKGRVVELAPRLDLKGIVNFPDAEPDE